MTDKSLELMLAETGDELPSNDSNNPTFASILERRFSRRDMMRTSLSAAVIGAFATAPVAALARPGFLPPQAAGRAANGLNPTLNFDSIPVVRSDTATVPHGYKVQTLAPWGTPITGSYPAFDGVNGNTGEEQEQQVGSHHDGIHYFPMADDPNGHGILCINHEYVDQRVFHVNGPTTVNNTRPNADEVRKEIAAHGVSVVEVKRTGNVWDVVVPSQYNRRVTAGTVCEISGPVRGSDFVKTKYSPNGTMARGTINNCGHGYTPWDTYLTCEENWAGYFVNRGAVRPREQQRYGVPFGGNATSRYRWDTVAGEEYERFNLTPTGASAEQDYRNEVNGHGWILEIDPFDPTSTPKKRTTMGRFAHEACVFATPQNGQPLAFYSGDDSRNEYIYKFVTKGRWNSKRRDPDMLDHGTLYVAVFNEDGSGEWRALDFNDPAFLKVALEKGVQFTSQADVLINTRLAADVVGATRMDRPEWGAVHPQTNEVYFALTNNSTRTEADAANPRAANPFGHIIRWREQGNRPWATEFEWDIFVLGGPESDSQILPAQNGPALDETNRFASPDGIWIDQNGILWIQTDMSGSQQAGGDGRPNFGENGMLAANPITGEIKRFLGGPFNQETTGVVSTPDGKSLFVNFQHPGDRTTITDGVTNFTSNWPDSGAVYRHPDDAPVTVDPNGPRPRSSTIVITREDGGVVGL